ncbi:MAG: hypothetical protein WA996_21570 [Candidatus Promineifilaceae bacterium]
MNWPRIETSIDLLFPFLNDDAYTSCTTSYRSTILDVVSFSPAEREMLASGRPLAAMVYKAGRHGARTSSCEQFLLAVQPQYMIVSSREGNSYGHPYDEVLERASDVGPAVLRTDELGTIEVVKNGERLFPLS